LILALDLQPWLNTTMTGAIMVVEAAAVAAIVAAAAIMAVGTTTVMTTATIMETTTAMITKAALVGAGLTMAAAINRVIKAVATAGALSTTVFFALTAHPGAEAAVKVDLPAARAAAISLAICMLYCAMIMVFPS